MSWLDGAIEESEVLSQTQRLEFTSDLPEPGAFKGSLDVLGPNLLRGGIEAGSAIESGFSSLWQTGLDAAAGAFLPEPKFGGTVSVTSMEEAAQETLGEGTAQVVQDLRPDPAEVGMVGQILGEAAAVLPRTAVAAAFGGPLAGMVGAGAPAGYSSKQVGMAEGLDESTATLKGVVDAATMGVGAVLPAAKFVKPLLGDAAIAVGANVGLGMAGRGLAAELLEGGGYHAQAAQYRAMDGMAIATDAVLGAAFFGIGRASMRRPTTEQVNAALTERNSQHFDFDTAPGAPINPRSAVAHQDALRTAVEQLSRGEPVVLPDSIHSAEFVRAADDAPPIAPGRDQALASARQDLEPALRVELEQEAAGILPNVKDVRAELATLSKSIDGLDATFRARAKEFQQEGQSRKQAEASAREAIASERLELTDRQTALNDSLTGNRTAELARADLVALNRGEVPKRFEGRLSQRPDAIVKGFDKSPLAAGVAKGNKVSLAQVAREEISRIMADLDRAEPTLQAKPLDIGQPRVAAEPATNAAKPGKDATQPAKTSTSDPKNATPEPKDATQAKGEQGDSDSVVQVADEILARTDDMRIATGALDEDGNPITLSARELLAQADADIARAQEESKGFAAAAACFLQRGAA
jgi:hypothetical protein